MNAFGMLVCCFVGRVQTVRRTLETKNSLMTSRSSPSSLSKESIAWDLPRCPIHHLLISHLHVSNFDTRKDILVIEYPVSLAPTGYMHMGSLLALNITMHDLHNEIMVLWNEKVNFAFKQLNYRVKEQMTFGPP